MSVQTELDDRHRRGGVHQDVGCRPPEFPQQEQYAGHGCGLRQEQQQLDAPHRLAAQLVGQPEHELGEREVGRLDVLALRQARVDVPVERRKLRRVRGTDRG